MVRRWTFLDYVSDSGRNVIRDWIDGQPQGVRKRLKAKLNARLLELEQVSGPFDRQHGVGQLRGNPCKGLFEVILRVDKTQFRVIGCYGPKPGQFTLLLGATEKDDRFTNPETCAIGQDRRARIHDDKHRREHGYD